MRNTGKTFTSLSLTALLAVSLAACSSTPQENTKAACDSYTAFSTAVSGLKTSLDSGSTVGDIQSARDKVSSTYSDLQKSLDKVSEDRKNALDSAWNDLNKAVSDVSPDMTVPEAKASLTDDVAKVAAAQTAVNEDLKC